MLLFSGERQAVSAPSEGSALPKSSSQSVARQFKAEGYVYPSYSVFRDVLNLEISSAKRRICVLARIFDDREIAYGLGLASRRAVAALMRLEPPASDSSPSSNPFNASDTLRAFGLTPWKESLKKLKLPEPTVIAIDSRAWSISSELSELRTAPVDVEPAPFTSAEVCGWADAAASAKAATR
jgi:hypothetical protein